jgi:polyisoprenoid-binding protein YceI
MKHLTNFLLSTVLTVGFAMPASAVEYKAIQPEKSKVTFQYKQMGVAMDGHFKKFAAQLNFDPIKPAAAKADMEIDLASIDAGSSDADDEVVGKTWFNVKAFPKATFMAKQIKARSANQFDVTGVLTIKGKSQDVNFPLKLVAQGNVAVFSGGFIMRRADFAIGEGIWTKFDVVANDIQVNFQLTAISGK